MPTKQLPPLPTLAPQVLTALPYDGFVPVDLAALPVAIYARLSRNPDGTKDSVEAQIELAIREVARRWPGRRYIIFSDDDITAADDDLGRDPEEVRPGYKALCDAVRGQQVGDVLCRMQHRISRGEAVWPHWKSVCLFAGITKLCTWLEGDVDMAPAGAMAGNIRNLFNAELIVKTKIAVKDRLDYNASIGSPPGGHRYGYRKGDRVMGPHGKPVGTLEVVDEHRATLERMAEWIFAGESQSDIARWLNDEGSRTATGALWRPSKIREVLCNPIIAGFRTHQVAKARAARGPDAKPHPYDGIVGRGTWEPIIDEDRWRLLVAHFTGDRVIVSGDTVVKVQASRGTARDYLLSGGLIRCGKCMARLHSARYTSRKGAQLPSYRCLTSQGGCGGTSISAPQAEAWAVAEALAYLRDDTELEGLMAEVDDDAETRAHIKQRREALAQQREELAANAVASGMSPMLAASMEQAIKDAEAELTALEAGLSVERAVIDWERIAQAWDDEDGDDRLSFGERRATLFGIGLLVTVGPAAGGVTKPETRLVVDFGEAPAPRERASLRRSKPATKTS
jgi:site-specific DNA recombinase